MTAALALAALAAWAVLLFGRGFFWLARDDDRDAPALPDPAGWPAVAILVPARDEEETIGDTVRSILAQDYPGPLRLLVVDDRSADDTAAAARAAAAPMPLEAPVISRTLDPASVIGFPLGSAPNGVARPGFPAGPQASP